MRAENKGRTTELETELEMKGKKQYNINACSRESQKKKSSSIFSKRGGMMKKRQVRDKIDTERKRGGERRR